MIDKENYSVVHEIVKVDLSNLRKQMVHKKFNVFIMEELLNQVILDKKIWIFTLRAKIIGMGKLCSLSGIEIRNMTHKIYTILLEACLLIIYYKFNVLRSLLE